jgi:hypothetical protein
MDWKFFLPISKTYLTAPTKGLDDLRFEERTQESAIIVRALYGLRGSGAAFQKHLAKLMTDLGFTSCKADPDVWMRKATKPDGTYYYEYVLC